MIDSIMASLGCQLHAPGEEEPQPRNRLSQFACGHIYGVFSSLPIDVGGPTPDR